MVKYSVNEEKRVVTAYLAGGKETIEESLFDYLDKRDPNGGFAFFYRRAVDKALSGFNGKVIGITHCHPDDEWDEKVGKKIARKKLLKSIDKLTKAAAKNLKSIVFDKLGEFQNRVDGL